jgi:alpha,alpha-trehalase
MKQLLCVYFVITTMQSFSQTIETPDRVYGELFTDVQMSGIFPDSKTFVDCIPKRDPRAIVIDYLAAKNNPALRFSLKLFVEENFEIPKTLQLTYIQKEKDVVAYIKNLWSSLKREADKSVEWSSLIALPHPYIVPGGRFREIYYWDSYFTMLGLKESGEYGMMQDMVDNLAWLISNYGCIPNGNRTYYLSRSQPPFFSMMVELLASVKGDSIYTHYLPALEKEFRYWKEYKGGQYAYTGKRISSSNNNWLYRYYDSTAAPRQESFREDSLLMRSLLTFDFNKIPGFAAKSMTTENHDFWFRLNQNRKPGELYKNLRTACESGWDFSSRWFANGKDIKTIEALYISPIDLNCLIYKLQTVLAKAYEIKGDTVKRSYYVNEAKTAKEKVILYYFFNASEGWFMDYHAGRDKKGKEFTLAGMFPLFLKIATKEQAARSVDFLRKNFLKPGGVVTTLRTTGQQWDAPNGWAPLQWITIIGLENYGYRDLAKEIARRWIKLNNDAFLKTGKLMEKYNVVNTKAEAGGGEYLGQDGFGWTNGVLLALIAKYGRP